MNCKHCGRDASDPYAVAGTVRFCSKACLDAYLEHCRDINTRPRFNPRMLKIVRKEFP